MAEILIRVSTLVWGKPSSASIQMGFFSFGAAILLFLWLLSYTRKPNKVSELYGPWKWMRHPELAARFLASISPVLASRNPFLFIVCLSPLVLTYKRRKDLYEKSLEKTFDVDFGFYQMEVPAVYPTLLSIVDPPGKSGKVFVSFHHLREECTSLVASPIGLVVMVQGGTLLVMFIRNYFF